MKGGSVVGDGQDVVYCQKKWMWMAHIRYKRTENPSKHLKRLAFSAGIMSINYSSGETGPMSSAMDNSASIGAEKSVVFGKKEKVTTKKRSCCDT